MHGQIKANAAIIRLVGIFEHKNPQQCISGFENIGYRRESLEAETQTFLKNTFYPEFRDLMFLGIENSSATILKRKEDINVTFIKEQFSGDIHVQTKLADIELYIFKNGLHFFSLQLDPLHLELEKLSDLMYCARDFKTEIFLSDKKEHWINWLETELLNGIQISSKDKQKVHVDEFSGSKFKLFSVIDIPELENNIDVETREKLLYDLGTVSMIGSAGGNSYHSPSQAYLELLMKDKISVFNNYTILPLFDSFTTLGNNLLTANYPQGVIDKVRSWSQTYFRIYLYNIFIKYNLFRYNLEMGDDSVKVRDEFESFLNTYNLSHISYNFLPNLLFHQHSKGLQIDEELQKFQERINRISQAIQEEAQKRSNLLLTFVGAMTSISGLQPLLEYLEIGRKNLGFGYLSYYPLLLVLLFMLAIPVLAYLFPEKKKQLLKKWKQRKA